MINGIDKIYGEWNNGTLRHWDFVVDEPEGRFLCGYGS